MKRLRRLEASRERLAVAPIKISTESCCHPLCFALKESRQVDDTEHLCAHLGRKAHEIKVLSLRSNR